MFFGNTMLLMQLITIDIIWLFPPECRAHVNDLLVQCHEFISMEGQ